VKTDHDTGPTVCENIRDRQVERKPELFQEVKMKKKINSVQEEMGKFDAFQNLWFKIPIDEIQLTENMGREESYEKFKELYSGFPIVLFNTTTECVIAVGETIESLTAGAKDMGLRSAELRMSHAPSFFEQLKIEEGHPEPFTPSF